MLNHLLISLALFSFSIVSNAAAIPMDVNQATLAAIPNAVLHPEGDQVQGGGSDKDVAETLTDVVTDSCQGNVACADAVIAADVPRIDKNQSLNTLFAMQDRSSALQPFVVLLLILTVIVIFLSRKSESTK